MSLFSWLCGQRGAHGLQGERLQASRKVKRRPAPQRHQLQLEALEDRSVPTTFFAATASALIADINAANKAGGTNTIILSSTPGGGPYALTAVNNTQDGANGLPVIAGGGRKVAADHLTIVGNGNIIERGSGAPAFRLFDVASGGSLTLQDVTLANGLAYGAGSAAQGGAVRSQGTLILSDVTVTDNEALGLSYQNNKGSKGSSSGDAAGGGIWSSGAPTVESYSLIQFNTVIGAGAGSGDGGGIAIAGGTATIDSSYILNNGALGSYD